MKKIIFLLLSVVLLSSCTGEYHYANSFLRKHKHANKKAIEKIYVCLPTCVYHTNSTLNAIPYFPYLSDETQDSLIAANTAILDKLNDSVFLAQFNNTFLYTLSRAKIPVIIVSNPEEMPQTSAENLTVIIPEIEAEEFVQQTRSDFYTKRGVYYAYDYDLRHFAVNVWFRFNTQNTTIYFLNNEIQDDFKGTVTSIRDQKATLRTHFTRITPNDAYRTARELAEHSAILYIERILTDHVKRNTGGNENYFLYNPYSNEINVIIPYEMGVQDGFEKL